jgi:hypothetical protein
MIKPQVPSCITTLIFLIATAAEAAIIPAAEVVAVGVVTWVFVIG